MQSKGQARYFSKSKIPEHQESFRQFMAERDAIQAQQQQTQQHSYNDANLGDNDDQMSEPENNDPLFDVRPSNFVPKPDAKELKRREAEQKKADKQREAEEKRAEKLAEKMQKQQEKAEKKPSATVSSGSLEDAMILGKEKRVVSAQIHRYVLSYGNDIPEIKTFKIKRTHTLEEMQMMLDEIRVIIEVHNTNSYEKFVETAVLTCVNMVEPATAGRAYDLTGLCDALKQNKMFTDACKELQLQYSDFMQVPAPQRLVLSVIISATVVITQNKARKAFSGNGSVANLADTTVTTDDLPRMRGK